MPQYQTNNITSATPAGDPDFIRAISDAVKAEKGVHVADETNLDEKIGEALQSYTMIKSAQTEAAIKCWSDILRDNIQTLKSDISDAEKVGFSYKTFGYHYVEKFEYDIVQKQVFRFAADAFARDKFILGVLYEHSPMDREYMSVQYPLSYLIRKENFDCASNILDALYNSRSFSKYAKLWRDIIEECQYMDEDHYSGSGMDGARIQAVRRSAGFLHELG